MKFQLILVLTATATAWIPEAYSGSPYSSYSPRSSYSSSSSYSRPSYSSSSYSTTNSYSSYRPSYTSPSSYSSMNSYSSYRRSNSYSSPAYSTSSSNSSYRRSYESPSYTSSSYSAYRPSYLSSSTSWSSSHPSGYGYGFGYGTQTGYSYGWGFWSGGIRYETPKLTTSSSSLFRSQTAYSTKSSLPRYSASAYDYSVVSPLRSRFKPSSWSSPTPSFNRISVLQPGALNTNNASAENSTRVEITINAAGRTTHVVQVNGVTISGDTENAGAEYMYRMVKGKDLLGETTRLVPGTAADYMPTETFATVE